jgi:hypothetical protein
MNTNFTGRLFGKKTLTISSCFLNCILELHSYNLKRFYRHFSLKVNTLSGLLWFNHFKYNFAFINSTHRQEQEQSILLFLRVNETLSFDFLLANLKSMISRNQ